MEYAPTNKYLDPGVLDALKFSHDTWKSRVRKAQQVLAFVKTFDDNFTEPIQICDIKGENFGFASDGSIKAIDVDKFLPDSKFGPFLAKQPPCSSDLDCIFLECQGRCEFETSKCQPNTDNNNLEVSKIFKIRN